MIPLGLGLLAAAGLMWGTAAFSRASVAGVKVLLAWLLGFAALAAVALLFATGREALVVPLVVVGGPLAWRWWQGKAKSGRGAPRGAGRPRGPESRRMSRVEALSVLGLAEGASDSDVQAAWVRLMRAVHPDSGGTDDLAARVNQARDVLLRRP